MKALYQKYPDVTFLILYVREAHPGNKLKPPGSYEEKRQRAQKTKDFNEFRTLLVDTVEGQCHQSLGIRPNFVYILNPSREVVFRSDWNVPDEVDNILFERNPKKFFERDHFEPHLAHPVLAIQVLMKAGILALVDIVLGLPQLLRMHIKSKKITKFPTS